MLKTVALIDIIFSIFLYFLLFNSLSNMNLRSTDLFSAARTATGAGGCARLKEDAGGGVFMKAERSYRCAYLYTYTYNIIPVHFIDCRPHTKSTALWKWIESPISPVASKET